MTPGAKSLTRRLLLRRAALVSGQAFDIRRILLLDHGILLVWRGRTDGS